MALDSEYKKLLAGDTWAEDGDRKDPEDTSVQPVIARNVGWQASFSTDDTPARTRMNQMFRELYGAAKELRMGVSAYDASVDYPVNAIVQHLGRLWRAASAHNSSSPVAPAPSGQSAWVEVSTSGVVTRDEPDDIPNSDILIDGDDGSSFRVFWNAPNDNNDDISQYDIRYAKNDSGFTQQDGITVVNNYTQGNLITLTGDDVGESDIFYVQVRARNGQGTPDWPTSPGKQVRNAPLAPEAIKFFGATAGDGQVVLNWPEPFMRGMALSKYIVEWKSGAQTFTRTGSRHKDVSSGTTTTVTSLSNNTTYTFRVTAVTTRNTQTTGTFTVDATPNVGAQADVPSTPTNLTAIRGNGSDVIAYTTGIPDDNNSKITAFVWEMRVEAADGQPENAWADPPAPNNATTDVPYNRFTSLSGGPTSTPQTWEIRMKARNSIGDSNPSNVAKRSPYYPFIPSQPLIDVEGRITPSAGGGTIAYITQQFSDGGADIEDIEWQRKLKSEGANAWTRVNPNDTSPYILTRTEAIGAEVQYRVRAKNSSGTGPWSAVQEVTAPGDVPGSASAPSIAFVNAMSIPNDSAGRPRALVYMISDITSTGSTISKIDWQYKPASGSTWFELKRSSALNAFWTIADGGILNAGTAYNFRAYATNSTGTQSVAFTHTFTPQSIFASSAPPTPSIRFTQVVRCNSRLYFRWYVNNWNDYTSVGGNLTFNVDYRYRYGNVGTLGYFPSITGWNDLSSFSDGNFSLPQDRDIGLSNRVFLSNLWMRMSITNSSGTSAFGQYHRTFNF